MIDSFLQYIQYRKNYSSYTVLSYHNDISQFQTFLLSNYNLSIDKAETTHIRDWMVALRQEKQSPASINRKLSALNSFYKYLLCEKQVNQNPTDGITSLKKPEKLPVFFRENEIDAAIGSHPAEENDFTEARKHIILEILYQTGIRRAELLGIKNSDFNFFSLTLRVTGKGNKTRICPFNKVCKD